MGRNRYMQAAKDFPLTLEEFHHKKEPPTLTDFCTYTPNPSILKKVSMTEHHGGEKTLTPCLAAKGRVVTVQ